MLPAAAVHSSDDADLTDRLRCADANQQFCVFEQTRDVLFLCTNANFCVCRVDGPWVCGDSRVDCERNLTYINSDQFCTNRKLRSH